MSGSTCVQEVEVFTMVTQLTAAADAIARRKDEQSRGYHPIPRLHGICVRASRETYLSNSTTIGHGR